ncbi:MAG: AAA family ATPase [Clostridia bacterium]|nr:AAA family ATPase [Clostridia bacterium]
MGKIISFSNQKGGVGKTTTCVNMAAYLAAAGKRVLLVDLDPQGNATTGLGFSKSSLKKSVYNVLIDDEDAKENILPTELDNLFLLPANIDLAGAEVELVYKQRREKVLKGALDKIKNLYDFILIDCPPSLGLITINALAAADSAIIPIQSEYYALEGLSQLMNSIARVRQHLNTNLQIEGVVLTMYDGRSLISKQLAAEKEEDEKAVAREILAAGRSELVGRPVRPIEGGLEIKEVGAAYGRADIARVTADRRTIKSEVDAYVEEHKGDTRYVEYEKLFAEREKALTTSDKKGKKKKLSRDNLLTK